MLKSNLAKRTERKVLHPLTENTDFNLRKLSAATVGRRE